jgi:hypothetical protein
MVAAPRYACGRCGRRATADRMVYSRHSGNRYCIDMGACAKRAAARKRRSA